MVEVIDQDITSTKKDKAIIERAIQTVAHKNAFNITVNLCSDQFMIQQNKKSLNHNYYTDIITYYYNTIHPLEDAEFLISIERVEDNAKGLGIPFQHEIARVAIHGCLHLMGFEDSTQKEKEIMRAEENKYLSKLFHVEQ